MSRFHGNLPGLESSLCPPAPYFSPQIFFGDTGLQISVSGEAGWERYFDSLRSLRTAILVGQLVNKKLNTPGGVLHVWQTKDFKRDYILHARKVYNAFQVWRSLCM